MKIAKRVELNGSRAHTKVNMSRDRCANLIVETFPQCIYDIKSPYEHFKYLIILLINYTSKS